MYCSAGTTQEARVPLVPRTCRTESEGTCKKTAATASYVAGTPFSLESTDVQPA